MPGTAPGIGDTVVRGTKGNVLCPYGAYSLVEEANTDQ